jgi:hypothetical protein
MQEVKITSPTWVGGEMKQAGDILPVSDNDARELFRVGRAQPSPLPQEETQPIAPPPETEPPVYPTGHSAKRPPASSK